MLLLCYFNCNNATSSPKLCHLGSDYDTQLASIIQNPRRAKLCRDIASTIAKWQAWARNVRNPVSTKMVNQLFSRGSNSNSYQFCKHSFFGNLEFDFQKNKLCLKIGTKYQLTLVFLEKKVIHYFGAYWKCLDCFCRLSVIFPMMSIVNGRCYWFESQSSKVVT